MNDLEMPQTLQDFQAAGAAKLAARRADAERTAAAALAIERQEFETAWNAVIKVVTDRWPFLAVDRPVFLKDDGTHGRLPSYSSQCELRLRLPAELAPISVLLEQRFDEAAKESRWGFCGRAIEVHELRVTSSGYSDSDFYVSTHDIAQPFYPSDFDAALALATEIGATRPALRDEAASLNERKRERNLERMAKAAAKPTDAEHALELVRELVNLVHVHAEQED